MAVNGDTIVDLATHSFHSADNKTTVFGFVSEIIVIGFELSDCRGTEYGASQNKLMVTAN